MFHTNIETIRTRVQEEYGDTYLEIYKRYSDPGKCSLRRNQFVLSKKNASMAIWLGKIWLGQKDPALEDVKVEMKVMLKEAVNEIERDKRAESAERSSVENQQPVLDQRLGGEPPQI